RLPGRERLLGAPPRPRFLIIPCVPRADAEARMNNTCPECEAVYTVAAKDVGRRIACKKCRTPLIVTERGLERDATAAADIDDAERRPGAGFFERLRNLADVPTYLFGAGAFLVIYFLFAPLIDAAKVARREGDIA